MEQKSQKHLTWARVDAICRKEWQELLYSPVAYIVIAIYLIITGTFIFFIFSFFARNDVNLGLYFAVSPNILAFIIPAVTMRLLSEEYRSGAIEILSTLPISLIEVVLGKFLAIYSFAVLMVVFTFGYPITISTLGELDWGTVFAGYVGQFFLIGAYCAIGLFASSLSRNGIVAFAVAAIICFLLSFIEYTLANIPGQLSLFLRYLSSGYHLRNFSNGIIDLRDVLYFISVMFLGIYGAWFQMRKHR